MTDGDGGNRPWQRDGEQRTWARHEAILRRAYEISLTQDGGTPEENWLRAEEELSWQQRPFP